MDTVHSFVAGAWLICDSMMEQNLSYACMCLYSSIVPLLLVSIQCSLDSTGDHSSHTHKQQCFEAPFLLFAGKSDIALQHS